jgi:phosphoribosylglycinamide formyltransferase-1
MKNVAFIVSNEGWLFEKSLQAQILGLINCNIKLLLTNNPNGGCIQRAIKYKVDYKIIPTKNKNKNDYSIEYLKYLDEYDIDIVVLMFNRLFSEEVVLKYKNRIINLHLSLLPSFQGMNPIDKAIEYGVKFLGATIHFVDEGVDSGPIIAQMILPFNPNFTKKDIFDEYGKYLPKFFINALDYILTDNFEIKERKVILKEASYNSYQFSPDIKNKFKLL